MSSMTPQEIVSELDRHIVGQNAAKRAVAIAMRNRWRRQQVDEKLRTEINHETMGTAGDTLGAFEEWAAVWPLLVRARTPHRGTTARAPGPAQLLTLDTLRCSRAP